MTISKNHKIAFGSFAVIISLLVGVILVWSISSPKSNSVMDVNPSIQITTNWIDRVLRIEPLNDDARVLMVNYQNTGNKFGDRSRMITMDQASNIVMDKSGQTNTFIQEIDFIWEDLEPLYQGEAFNEGVKYSFEIYAYSGEFQKWDTSDGDETWAEKHFNAE